DLAEAVRDGRRREFASFGWRPDDVPDPQAPETFARSRLDWSELEKPPHAELLDWHRRLIALRRSTPSLADGRLDRVEVRFDDRRGWLTMTRGEIVVACNLSDTRFELPAGGRLLLASSDDV